MIKKISKTNSYLWDVKNYLYDFLQYIENINELSFLKEKIEELYHNVLDLKYYLEKTYNLNYYRIISNFECLENSIQGEYVFKVCGIKTNLSELLEVAKGISKEAYDFGYLDICYSFMNRMVVVKKMYIFDTQWVRVLKDEYKKEEILDLILKRRQKNEQNN